MKKTLLTIIAIIVCIFTLTACKDEKITLVGSWAHGEYVYNFKEDNTGSYDAYGTELKFTYEDKGDKVSILYTGDTAASTYEYRIEGKTLIIKDSFGEAVKYERK